MGRSARLPFKIVALGAVILVLALAADLSSADHVPPVAGEIDIIAIDMDPTGNTPTSVAAINPCSTASVGGTVDVDIIVDEIHSSDMISSVEVSLLYDAAVIEVEGRSFASGTLIGQAGTYWDSPSDPIPDHDGNYLHNAFDMSGPHEWGEGIVVRLTLEVQAPGVSQLQLTDSIELDGEPNIRDTDSVDIPINQILNAEIRADGTSCEPDDDADGWVNSADNCRYWYNPAQNLPTWSVPTGDSDCDGFPDTVTAGGRGRENFITTDAADHCADTTTANDEEGPLAGEPVSPWPPDINDTRLANLSDIVAMGSTFNKSPPDPNYRARANLNASGGVNLSDVVAMGPFFNKGCT